MRPPLLPRSRKPSRRRRASLLDLLAAIALLSLPASAQDTAPIPATVEDALHQMADQAGVIFTGEVIAIKWRQGENGASGVVEVAFRVDEAVRGCTAGSTYKLTEWAGLWAGGDPRYNVGQRLLLMLHPPGAGGASSPVGGMAGVIPIRGTTPAPQAATEPVASAVSSVGATAAVQTAEIADLRWVGTRLLRSPTALSSPVVTGSGLTDGAGASTTGDSSVATQQAPIATVVQMLRSWQQAGQ